MVDLDTHGLKRGGYARDVRTGMAVKIAEVGGRDLMVKPAYKSDGVWVDPAHLRPIGDPHAWTGRQLFWLLVALLVAAGVAYRIFNEVTAQGLGTSDAIACCAVPTGAIALVLLTNLFGLNRS
jgi:hypothetical protein